jgi:hypothetical protein
MVNLHAPQYRTPVEGHASGDRPTHTEKWNGSNKMVLDRENGRGGARRDGDLFVAVLGVMFGRLRCYSPIRNF